MNKMKLLSLLNVGSVSYPLAFLVLYFPSSRQAIYVQNFSWHMIMYRDILFRPESLLFTVNISSIFTYSFRNC